MFRAQRKQKIASDATRRTRLPLWRSCIFCALIVVFTQDRCDHASRRARFIVISNTWATFGMETLELWQYLVESILAVSRWFCGVLQWFRRSLPVVAVVLVVAVIIVILGVAEVGLGFESLGNARALPRTHHSSSPAALALAGLESFRFTPSDLRCFDWNTAAATLVLQGTMCGSGQERLHTYDDIVKPQDGGQHNFGEAVMPSQQHGKRNPRKLPSALKTLNILSFETHSDD